MYHPHLKYLYLLMCRFHLVFSLFVEALQDTDGDGKNDGDEVLRYGTSPLVGKPIADDITTEAECTILI
jgi:hypothetical protein